MGEGSKYPAGILICERLYESVKPALSGKKLAEYPVEVYPQNCSANCLKSREFKDAAERISEICSFFCVLTCSYPDISVDLDEYSDRLIKTRQGAELLIPADLISEINSAGEYFLFPSGSAENADRISHLPFAEFKENNLSGIVVPDTGAGAVTEEFIRGLEKQLDVPVRVEKTGLDFFENYLAGLLYKAGYKRMMSEFWRSEAEREELSRKVSDSLMAMDMLGLLVGLKDEENVIETTIEFISMLCSPEQVVYAGVRDGKINGVSKLKQNLETISGIDLSPGTDLKGVTEKISSDGVILPVTVWGEIVGLLSVEGVLSPAESESCMSTIRLFLPLCGLAVKNARNYHDLETAIAERDEEIELRKEAEKNLSAAIRKLNLLSGVTRHDILNQIIVANFYLETAIEDSPDCRERLGPVKKSIDEIHRQIEFTKNYQDLGILPPSWQNSPQLIRRCFEERDYPACISVEIDLPETEFLADAMLGKAFCNVISNAYNHAEGMKNLKITGRPAGDAFLVTIADDGEGVPDDKKDLIFKAGHGKNHGYGLFLVKEILGLTGIEIRETGVPGEGAVFEIEIPSGSWRFTEILSP